MAALPRGAQAGILEQVEEPQPRPWFAEAAMNTVALAVGFDGYCLFGVDPWTGLRSVHVLTRWPKGQH